MGRAHTLGYREHHVAGEVRGTDGCGDRHGIRRQHPPRQTLLATSMSGRRSRRSLRCRQNIDAIVESHFSQGAPQLLLIRPDDTASQLLLIFARSAWKSTGNANSR
jgi:hypothetical protein